MSDPRSHMKAMIASMKNRTGRTLEEWVEKAKKEIPAEKKGRLKWIKETYGLGQSTAYMILNELETDGQDPAAQDEEMVDNQYKKENEPLRPLFEWLSGELLNLGSDTRISPCKTYVAFYRKKQFVFVKPHKGKLNIGLALPEGEEHPRLESAKGLGGAERLKWKFTIETKADFDDELRALVQQSYELS